MTERLGFTEIDYFKNFNMGRELEISGEFIYESAIKMNCLSYIGNHFEVNTILYNGSVGIERLQKILLCMYMKSSQEVTSPLKCFTKHNHIELHTAINKRLKVPADKNILCLLEVFRRYYDDFRYAEYQLSYKEKELCELLINFIDKRIGVSLSLDYPNNENDYLKMKSFYINLLGKIALLYFRAIRNKAEELNLFTYEIDSFSNAMKIFYRQDDEKLYDVLQTENYALKELIIYLKKTKKQTNFLKYLRSFEPLDFDAVLIPEYLTDIVKYKSSTLLNDFVESIYSDFDSKQLRERKELLDLMSSNQVMWEDFILD